MADLNCVSSVVVGVGNATTFFFMCAALLCGDIHSNIHSNIHAQRRVLPFSGGTSATPLVSYIDMFWLIPVGFFVALVALVTLVFVGSIRNARALRRDVDERFNDIQGKLEQQANALAELLTRKPDSEDRK